MEYYGLVRSLRSAGYYETAHHKDLLRNVKHAIYDGNLVVLSGVIGAGKTAALSQLQELSAKKIAWLSPLRSPSRRTASPSAR